MLTKKEIEELKEMAENQSDLPSSTVLGLIGNIETLVQMLKSLEFTRDTGRIGGAIYKFCPVCKATEGMQNHDKNCKLYNILKLYEE